jgi:iron complex transport system ATP-binding protein
VCPVYLCVDHLTCGYGSRPVLKEFSASVARGEFVAVVGPNGCGKSTLIKAISRVLRPTGGRVLLDGRDLADLRPRDVARQLAVVAQESTFEFDFTVEEVVLMGRLPHLSRFRGETEQDRRIAREAMAATDTLDLASRLVTRLSGGERQRVMVARALAQEPSLLILDEPTAHLDIAHQVDLLDLTRRLNRERGLTVLAVLHDLNLAAQYAGRLLMVKDGRPFADGTPAAVVTEANVASVYGSRVRVVPHPVEGSPHLFLLSGDPPGSGLAS